MMADDEEQTGDLVLRGLTTEQMRAVEEYARAKGFRSVNAAVLRIVLDYLRARRRHGSTRRTATRRTRR